MNKQVLRRQVEEVGLVRQEMVEFELLGIRTAQADARDEVQHLLVERDSPLVDEAEGRPLRRR